MLKHFAILQLLLLVVGHSSAALSSAHQTLFTDNGWTISQDGADYIFSHTGVVDTAQYTVGTFPNRDNPNTIQTQNYQIYIPQSPAQASQSSCTPMGYVGFAINGAAIFNPLTAESKDAVTGSCAEVFDDCQGHPDERGRYHYHQNPSCITTSKAASTDPIGIALDGYLIYRNVDENGNTLTASDLDSCGGRTGTGGDYRYHLQTTYPYTLGCFSGTTSSRQNVMTQCNTLSTCGTQTIMASGLVLAFSLLVGHGVM